MADTLPAGAIPVAPEAAAAIVPRFDLYTTGEDHLRIMAVNSLAGVVLTIAGRSWDPLRRVILPITRTLTPTSDRTTSQILIPLAAGFLLDMTVFASVGTPVTGQTYVMVQLVRGLTANAPQLGMLASDYITSQQCVCWPGSQPKSSTEGEPYVRTIVGTQPAVGVEIAETVPTGARWELIAFSAFLTKSAILGGPMQLRRANGANLAWQAICSHNHNAGAAITYVFAQGWSTVIAGPPGSGTSNSTIPNTSLLTAGDVLRTSLINDAGDQWSAPILTVREWLEVP